MKFDSISLGVNDNSSLSCFNKFAGSFKMPCMISDRDLWEEGSIIKGH